MITTLVVPFTVTAVSDEQRTFSGLADAWATRKDGFAVWLQRGAFARTLEHWERSRRKRRIGLIHGEVRVGELASATETAEGLLTTFHTERFAFPLLRSLRDSQRIDPRLAIEFDPIRRQEGRLFEVMLLGFRIDVNRVIPPDDPARIAAQSRLDALRQGAYAS